MESLNRSAKFVIDFKDKVKNIAVILVSVGKHWSIVRVYCPTPSSYMFLINPKTGDIVWFNCRNCNVTGKIKFSSCVIAFGGNITKMPYKSHVSLGYDYIDISHFEMSQI